MLYLSNNVCDILRINWDMPLEVGRPSKFTPERRQTIYNALADGATYAICARLVGVAEKTLYDWLKTGRELRDSDREDFTEHEQEFVTFCNEFDRIENEYLLGLIRDVGKSNKQWMLTKRMKSEFDDVQNINVNAKVETTHSWKDIIEKAEKEE